MSEEKPYEMPPIQVARVVNWYADAQPSTKPEPAIVTNVTGRNIDIGVVHRDLINLDPRAGVMHISDPRAKHHHAESGAWDYTDWDKMLMEGSSPGEPDKEQPQPKSTDKQQSKSQQSKKVA